MWRQRTAHDSPNIPSRDITQYTHTRDARYAYMTCHKIRSHNRHDAGASLRRQSILNPKDAPTTYPHTYVWIHTYVHTCYVLTKPPIPSSRCKDFVFLRPVEILLRERGHPRVPPCNVLKFYFFIFLKQSLYIKRPVENLLHERGHPRGDPFKPLIPMSS